MRRPITQLVAATTAVALGALAPAAAAAQGAPADRPPAMAGEVVSVLAPGNSGTVTVGDQLAGEQDPHLDDQSDLYWGLQGYSGQGFADPAAAVRTEQPADGVRIYWDDHGVPAVYGDSGRDVWVGAGYAVAQIRLFMLDAVRRMARGTFAELVGPSGVPADVQTRVLTYTDAEYQAMFDALSAEARDAVEGYVEGANLWIEEVSASPEDLPAEYALLSTTPQPLDVVDVLAAGVLITRSVASEGGGEMGNVALLRQLEGELGADLGRAVFTDLVWQDDSAAAVTVPAEEGTFPDQGGDRAAAFAQMADYAATLPLALADGPGTGAFPQPSGILSPLQSGASAGTAGADPGALVAHRAVSQLVDGLTAIRGGSVAAAIGPARSADGGPLLLSGPQLGYGYPSLLVELEVHGGGYDARGAGVPGLPTVGIGYTDRVAWALTTGFSKTIDSFIETVRPAGDGLEHLHQGTWRPAACRSEQVRYRESLAGLPVLPALRSVEVEVCRTTHGPIVSDIVEGPGGQQLARSVQHHMWGRELETVEGILAWNRASTLEEFEAAVRRVTWNENVTYADADGHIAFWHPGIHLRRPDGADARLPLPGDGTMDLGAPLPFEALPHAVDPVQGYLANWNNKPAVGWGDGEGYGYASRPGGAVQRVSTVMELIASRDDHTLASLTALEQEAGLRDPRATPFVPIITAALEGRDGRLAEVAALLEGWNRRHVDPAAAPTTYGGPGGTSTPGPDGTDGPAPTVFDAIIDQLVEELLGGVPDELVARQLSGGSHVYDQVPALNLVLRILDPSTSALQVQVDYLGGRTRDQVVVDAVEGALAALEAAHGSTSLDAYRRPTARSSVDNLTGEVGPSTTQPYMDRGTYIHAVDFGPLPGVAVGRMAGDSRVATAIDASRQTFPDGASTVVLAAAGEFADALIAAPLAGALDAPLLLVDGRLGAPGIAEVERLGVDRAVIVGGTAAITEVAEEQLTGIGVPFERLAGDDRFDTAARVAEAVRAAVPAGAASRPPGAPDAYIASVSTFADALSISGVAARTATPVLLVERDRLPVGTIGALRDLGADSVVLLGGEAVISADVAADLPPSTRLAGLDRYGTASEILRHARTLGLPFTSLVLATGEDFPDGLAAGAVAAQRDGVVVLVRGLQPDTPGPALGLARTQRASVREVVLMGGDAVMSEAFRRALE